MLESKMCCGRKKTESRVRDMRGTGVRLGRSGLHHYGVVRGTERQHISRLKGEEGLSQRSCAGSTLHAVGTARAQALRPRVPVCSTMSEGPWLQWRG